MLSSFDIVQFVYDTYRVQVKSNDPLVATTSSYLNGRDLPITPNLFSHVMGNLVLQHDALLFAVSFV